MTGWPQLDASAALPSDVPHDLFGGDLFGDELMEIYNSAAVVEGGTTDAVSGGSTQKNGTDHPPGSQVAMDDGLGAFRPSTSFNDLTILLAPAPSTAVTEPGTAMAPLPVTPAPAGEPAAKKNGGKKRGAGAARTDGPSTKKRATGQRARGGAKSRGSASGKSAKQGAASSSTTATGGASSAGQAALKLRREQQALKTANQVANNTPNPLGNALVASKSVVPQAVGAKPGVVQTSAQTSSNYIAQRIGGSGKGDSITSEAAAATAAAAAVARAAAALPNAPPPAITEADFKSVAQAAVTNLILNAGTTTKTDGVSSSTVTGDDSDTGGFGGLNGKIDTSTEHIKALTSSNWVAACAGVDSSSAATAAAAAAADCKANNRARRQNLTPDERARQNRDRNREHARNTRLRKKAYVEELKRTLTELVAQRDAAELEKRHGAQRELEQREVRFRVMEEFLKLRGRNEVNFARWVAILEDGFSLTLPVTEFRKMVHEEPETDTESPGKTEQVLDGPTEVMSDSTSLSTFLQSLGNGSDDLSKATVSLLYHCDRKNFLMDGCNAVLEWTAKSVGAVNQGAPYELTLKGTMRAKFCAASNKLISAKIAFDTGSVSAQLQHLILPMTTGPSSDAAAAAEAAQAAANEADALLDSLQMPQLSAAVPSAITVVRRAVSVTDSSEKEESSDESVDDTTAKTQATEVGVATRRSTRRKD